MKTVNIVSGEELISLIRNTGLIDNPGLRPYWEADITLCSLAVETLLPLAKYVLQNNLVQLERVQEALLAQGLDVLQLPGRVEIISGSERIVVAPPVVEEWPSEGRLVVDGLHRIWLARRQGVEHVTCVLIRKASMPLVPLPVGWNEVREYSPGNHPPEKRLYRFNSISEVGTIEQVRKWGVTESNFRYFFFRDLAGLGSSGIRQFSLSEEGRSLE